MTNVEIQKQIEEVYRTFRQASEPSSEDTCVEATAKIIQSMIFADKVDLVIKKIYGE